MRHLNKKTSKENSVGRLIALQKLKLENGARVVALGPVDFSQYVSDVDVNPLTLLEEQELEVGGEGGRAGRRMGVPTNRLPDSYRITTSLLMFVRMFWLNNLDSPMNTFFRAEQFCELNSRKLVRKFLKQSKKK